MDNEDLSAGLEVDERKLTAAESKAISLPPALVEMVQGSPDLLVQLARGQLALVQDRMVRRVLQDPQATSQQFAQVHDALAKVAFGKGGAGGGGEGVSRGPQFQINILRAPKRGDGVTIDAQSVTVGEEA